MARIKADQPLVPSVLDRLLDDEPENKREPARSRSQLLRELKQTVRRDLENLLNTRRSHLTWPAAMGELKHSLMEYGLPDFTGSNMGAAEARDEFRQTIEEVVRRFEPRLQDVRVVLLDNSEPLDRTLRFRIDALLRADPAPEPVTFDTVLEPGTGNVEVKGGGP
jgi:type VI secretion system protein ImpF